MSAITLDTLKLAQKLRDNAKFAPDQAEQTAIALSESLTDCLSSQQLVTKADLTAALAETRTELIKWVVGVGFAQIAMLAAIFKFH